MKQPGHSHDEKIQAQQQRYLQNCIEVMQNQKCRITEARKYLALAIGQSEQSFTIKELYDVASQQSHLVLDFATVFRTVKTFQKIGLIHFDSDQERYFPCFHAKCDEFIHFFVSCEVCHEKKELHLDHSLANILQEKLQVVGDIKCAGGILHMRGVCENCRCKYS